MKLKRGGMCEYGVWDVSLGEQHPSFASQNMPLYGVGMDINNACSTPDYSKSVRLDR